MRSYTRIMQPKPPTDIFTQIEKFARHTHVDGMDINQCIASFGNPLAMTDQQSYDLAVIVRRSTMNSYWQHYAPKPDLSVFDLEPDPDEPPADNIKPPPKHFLLRLNQPGITHRSISAAIHFLAKAISMGLLLKGSSLAIDAPLQAVNNDQQTSVDAAIIHLVSAIATGHQRALQQKRSYHHFILRFHPLTLNESCARVLTDILAEGKHPRHLQLQLAENEPHLATILCHTYPDKLDFYPLALSIAFVDDETAASHPPCYQLDAPPQEPAPPAPTKRNLFSEYKSPPNEMDDLSQQLATLHVRYK